MNDNVDMKIGNLVRAAYADEALNSAQRQSHLRRIANARANLDGRKGGLLEERRLEVGVIAATLAIVLIGAVIWQIQFGATGDDSHTSDTPVSGIAGSESTATPVTKPEALVDIETLQSLALVPEAGTAHYSLVEISSDARLDHGASLAWMVESWDRVIDDGTRQLHIVAHDPQGILIAEYIRNGDRWYWNNRGWIESGNTTQMIETPFEIRLAQQEYFNLADLFEREPDDVLVSSEDSIVQTYALESFQETEWLAAINGLNQHRYVGEVTLDTSGAHVLRSEMVLIGESNERASMRSVTYLDASVLGAEEADDNLFIIPEIPEQRELQYGISDSDGLPFGLSVDRHAYAWPDEGERVVLVGDGVSLEVRVSRSLGGLDIQSWDGLSRLHYPTLGTGSLDVTDAFSVAWRENTDDGSIMTAIGDDGHFQFEIRTVPATWGQDELATLMEALSDAGS